MTIKTRPMQESDIAVLAEEFGIKQGWKGKDEEQFAKYFAEHVSGTRHVLVAEFCGSPAGYVTLLPNCATGPFTDRHIPVVCDFNVLIKFQRQGVGTALMDAVENLAKETSDTICLGVGLYTSYGAAQRMYIKRGYIPDGSGVWYNDKNLLPYEPCLNDDDLVLYLSKKL